MSATDEDRPGVEIKKGNDITSAEAEQLMELWVQAWGPLQHAPTAADTFDKRLTSDNLSQYQDDTFVLLRSLGGSALLAAARLRPTSLNFKGLDFEFDGIAD